MLPPIEADEPDIESLLLLISEEELPLEDEEDLPVADLPLPDLDEVEEAPDFELALGVEDLLVLPLLLPEEVEDFFEEAEPEVELLVTLSPVLPEEAPVPMLVVEPEIPEALTPEILASEVEVLPVLPDEDDLEFDLLPEPVDEFKLF
ncbi:hypothetical protein [Rufibacter roseus]|uniref:Uncharacterized protein n=1 Tax=Rufibacter roseus TaxID=1567108 RepID=A0ABW2DPB6_9BACT|nr:hypothetical protein [Rufibacter roseus]